MEEWALCIYGFRVVLWFCRQLFSSVKYFCGFLQLFSSFQYFIFIVQISFTNENLNFSAGTKEEIVRTKVENKLQWVHLSFILEISFVLIIIQQHDSASVLFLSLSRACNLPSHVFRQLARPIQVRERQRELFVTNIKRSGKAVSTHNLFWGKNVCDWSFQVSILQSLYQTENFKFNVIVIFLTIISMLLPISLWISFWIVIQMLLSISWQSRSLSQKQSSENEIL